MPPGKELTTNTRWQLGPLMAGLAFAGMLLATWMVDGPVRQAWDALDARVFYWLNGSLAEGESWRVFWALVNHRAYDAVAGLAAICVYIHYVFAAPDPAGRRERMAQGLFILSVIVIAMSFFKPLVSEFRRDSPSKVLEPVWLLSELVPWIKAKDSSSTSFPGDHTTVLLIFSGLLLAYAGRRYLPAVILVLLAGSVPRLVSGAHWLTDELVGSGFIALTSLVVAWFTPMRSIGERLARHATDFMLALMNSHFPALYRFLLAERTEKSTP